MNRLDQPPQIAECWMGPRLAPRPIPLRPFPRSLSQPIRWLKEPPPYYELGLHRERYSFSSRIESISISELREAAG